MTDIAIIGAGLAGLTAANRLKDRANVTVFEKSRGVGGRMSTRRAEPYTFDHGAQFFTAYSDAFKAFIAPMIAAGIIERWDARAVEIAGREITRRQRWGADYPHYVGVPGMNAIAKYLCRELQVQLGVEVQSMSKNGGKWSLADMRGNRLGNYDWVISTAPAEQTSVLLPASLPFSAQVKAVTMDSCFALMLGFEHALPLEFDAAFVAGEDIGWIAVNSTKPQRKHVFCLLIHSTNHWANAHIDDNRDRVLTHLCGQASAIVGQDIGMANHKAIHGWRYAHREKQTGDTHFVDTVENIGVCGDWLVRGRVEAAFTSGNQLAGKILA